MSSSSKETLLILEPRNRRLTDIVAAGDFGKRLALLAALDRLALLVFELAVSTIWNRATELDPENETGG
jgi:hypothetical protein